MFLVLGPEAIRHKKEAARIDTSCSITVSDSIVLRCLRQGKLHNTEKGLLHQKGDSVRLAILRAT